MINFNDLDPDFAVKAEQLLDICQEQGLTFEPISGLRTLQSQGALWRQSRTKAVITQKLQDLRAQGFDCLADAIDSAGPQYGPHVTDAIPGLSAHNWGEAMDVEYVGLTKDGTPPEGITDVYKFISDQAISIGLTAGYYFADFQDKNHIQLRPIQILDRFTLKEVNDHFANIMG